LSYRFWMNRFGGDRNVIGRVIHLNTYPFTIVGVSPPPFYDLTRGLDPEIRIPRMPAGQVLKEMELVSGTDGFEYQTMARLKPGVTMAQAQAVADAEFQEILRTTKSPETQGDRHIKVLPGDRGWLHFLQEFSAPLFVLFGLTGGVLLIACANVASMLLARAASRQRELAVRCSVGAGRARLIRQMLAESLLLAIGGAAVGVAAAFWSGPLLLHFLPRSNINLALDLHPDARALWFTIALSIVTGILFGLAPALHATRGDLAGSLKTDSPSSTADARTAILRKALVAAQVAFSLTLLIAAGLFVRTAGNLRPTNWGVDPNRVLQFMIKPQLEIYSDAKKHTLMAELLRRIGEVPGVESVALAHPGPFTGSASTRWAHVPGHEVVRMEETDWVTAGFIQTFGLRLIAGRDFSATDKPGSPLVAVINQKLAHELFGRENAIGRSFQIDSKSEEEGTYQVIGVIADATYWNLRGAPGPMAFVTYQSFAPYMPVVHVRINNPDTASMFAAIRRVFDQVDTGFPIFNVKTEAMQIGDASARERMVASLASGFGLLALVLAAVGLYGILAFSVARRTREIGLRMALGSGSAAVVWMMAKEALKLVAIGCGVGLIVAILVGRLFAAYLYGVSPADPMTIASSAALMLAIAAAAVSIPAWRAARIDPLRALHHD
ncbi:MAG TPA: ABC transporter permease, partial [Bryobacteraceae bacterium]|nr:ABC transporter permease [Bryobacteraceae bacterium]